jgi:hypothetical protein
VIALERAAEIGFGTFILSAPTAFRPRRSGGADARRPRRHRPPLPGCGGAYAQAGWELPRSIDRIYDPALAEQLLGFRCRTDFAAVLDALRSGSTLPFVHDASYVSPLLREPRA